MRFDGRRFSLVLEGANPPHGISLELCAFPSAEYLGVRSCGILTFILTYVMCVGDTGTLMSLVAKFYDDRPNAVLWTITRQRHFLALHNISKR